MAILIAVLLSLQFDIRKCWSTGDVQTARNQEATRNSNSFDALADPAPAPMQLDKRLIIFNES